MSELNEHVGLRGVVESIQLGTIQQLEGTEDPSKQPRPWTSAIYKRHVEGSVRVARTSLVGDEQADLKHHGGADKAILAYAAEHYPAWNREYPASNFEPGGFGENLTVAGHNEDLCCLGDIYRLGDSLLQISQPRLPCWKLSRRWGIPQFALTVQTLGRTGWYLRVLAEGSIAAGQTLEIVERAHPKMTVAWANLVMHGAERSTEQELALADCPALSESWKVTLRQRAHQQEQPDSRIRLEGTPASPPS